MRQLKVVAAVPSPEQHLRGRRRAYLTIAAQQHLPPAGQPPRKPPATSGSTRGGGAAFPAGSSPVWSAASGTGERMAVPEREPRIVREKEFELF